MHKKNHQLDFENELCISFWIVNDIFTFENVGVAKTTEDLDITYLCCADCDMGPIGFFDKNDPKKNYISKNRVVYL